MGYARTIVLGIIIGITGGIMLAPQTEKQLILWGWGFWDRAPAEILEAFNAAYAKAKARF